uniref:Uncharacterized protein n=1 Tax=Rhizophora mucronata TaxID=61149 RepID=A0A2P2J1Y3_RHIMU
MNYSLLMD